MKRLLLTLLTLLLIVACTNERRYAIGVSQCSEDDWRSLLNMEIDREARFLGDMDVENVSANDDSRKQTADIERFIAEKKDLIIVAPNVADDIRPAIEKAMDTGIPVILIDRRTSGDKYSAFIGADNRAIGQSIRHYIEEQCGGETKNVIELCGLDGSTPAIERHEGFVDSLRACTYINILTSENGDWNEEDAMHLTDSLLKIYPQVDFIYAHNDRMALGAYKAVKAAGRFDEIKIVGVDGLITPGGGVDMILDGKLLATHTYPTGGSEAILLAHKILTGEHYDREITLPSTMVDSSNARAMHLQYLTMKNLDEKYLKLEQLTDRQLEKINQQRWMLGGVICILLLIAVGSVIVYRLYREKGHVNELMLEQIKTLVFSQRQEQTSPVVENDASTNTQSASSLTEHSSAGPSSLAPSSTEMPSETMQPQRTSTIDSASAAFLVKVETIITKRLGDSDLSVNDIADELGMSRVQLYRKIKAMSEHNVNELIRKARLEQALQLLQTTNKNVSEVAYQVGFSSPSYFTKCFKEYFGKSPSDIANG